MKTIPLEQTIDELRLELRYCQISRRERADTEQRLAEAEAELALHYRQIDEAIAAFHRRRRR